MKNRIKILIIRFKNELKASEIKFFRGAVLDCVRGSEHDAVFSGHTEDGLRYSYPLIQYKRIGGRAALVCLGDGVESIGEFFLAGNLLFKIGNREPERFEIESVDAKQMVVQAWDDSFRYTIRNWLPFNTENYCSFRALDGLVARTEFLEHILVGNILSMCKGLGLFLDREVFCEILQKSEPRGFLYKGVKMLSFDVEFKSNVTLPDFCGLGKGASLGMGMVKMMKKDVANKIKEI